MRINHNIASLNTYRQLSSNAGIGQKSLEKLSSGLRINKAGDDAAGLAISEKMRAQVRGLDQASRNAQDGISMIQTAEGGLSEVHSILQRMRELADQSANGTNTSEDRSAIQAEVNQLKSEIDRIGDTTEFNTQKLLNGSLKSAGGASTAQNSTTGAVISKLTAGNVAATSAINSVAPTNGTFVKETMTIDGTQIEVNWQDLTADQKNVLKNVGTDAASRNAAKDLIINTINSAIDASGKNVGHVSGYINSAGGLTIESGTKGTDSKIVAGAAGVLKQVLNTGTTTNGTSSYNGTAITAATKADLEVNGVLMSISLSAVSNGLSMASVASQLQTNINTSITAYNGTTGKTSGEAGFIEAVTVKATAEGRLVISSQSGPVEFADRSGKTAVADLGLSSAQTDASGNGGMTFQIGANKNQSLNFGINDMRSAALGISGLDVSTAAGSSNALTTLDSAIKNVSSERSKLGAVQNRLEHTINNLQASSENLTAAESRIRDVDMAKEMMEFTKNNILSQAAQSMLAQANQQPQGVLQLLR